MNKLTDFVKGIITGFLIALIISGIIVTFVIFRRQDKEAIEYVERQQVIEALQDDYVSRDPVEFLDVPGVRGAAEEATDDFNRKLDEILQRFRSRVTN